ncbi:MAG: Coenzyme F420 hydrogenase/dehydrogenase, beta subunit C-terminal domain [Candidatus Thorarchaeota archaeon]
MDDKLANSLSIAQAWIKKNTNRNPFTKLKEHIIDTGTCTECGACVSNCPVDALTGQYKEGKYVPKLTGKCIACGICYDVCPRTASSQHHLLGSIRSAWRVKATEEYPRSQNGGAVTALLCYVLEKMVVDGTVVACQDPDKPWHPVPKIRENKEEVINCAGTIYTHTPIVEGVMEGFRKGLSALAVVGTSCNLDAITNMQNNPAGVLNIDLKHSVFKIGLFCMESFNYEKMKEFLKKDDISIEDVEKFSIEKGKLIVDTSEVTKKWPISNLAETAASSCSYCRDLTAKNADISCGNLGTDSDWTTVLVRTIEGEHIFQAAIEAGYLEAEDLSSKGLRILERIARMKFNRLYSLQSTH